MAFDHSDRPLHRRDLLPDPVEQLRRWLDDARDAGVALPEAMALATADAEGRPSVRHVLMRGLDPGGIVFFTNYGSRKADELSVNPNAAAVFLWRELDRQVSTRGPVERTSAEESEAYFRTRPREARIGAWASLQSRPVGSREELDERYREIDARYPGDDVPLPPHWGGFRLRPESFEFWKGRAHRLHDRFGYARTGEGWTIERL
ncbi:MAG: pyridoxamine 5'-phosphate oxidase, partial [Actinomycetota bacterium]